MLASAPVKTTDGRFGYEAAGSLGMPPLVFLHGIGGAARVWRRQLDAFGDRYHAITLDLPGYGSSASLANVSIPGLARALQDFLDQIGAIKPILVGHSIGGMIVQQWLVRHPVAARAVVLAQTSPAFGKPDGDWQRNKRSGSAAPFRLIERKKHLWVALIAGACLLRPAMRPHPPIGLAVSAFADKQQLRLFRLQSRQAIMDGGKPPVSAASK